MPRAAVWEFVPKHLELFVGVLCVVFFFPSQQCRGDAGAPAAWPASRCKQHVCTEHKRDTSEGGWYNRLSSFLHSSVGIRFLLISAANC